MILLRRRVMEDKAVNGERRTVNSKGVTQMQLRSMKLAIVAAMVLCVSGLAQAADLAVTLWEVPAGAEPGSRDGWKPAKAAASYAGGAALENGKIVVVAAIGGDSIMLIPADRTLKASAQIVPVADGKGFGKITGVKVEKPEESEASLKVSFSGADLSIDLGQG